MKQFKKIVFRHVMLHGMFKERCENKVFYPVLKQGAIATVNIRSAAPQT